MKDIDRLLRITKGCRSDMHEPDEHGLTAAVVGTSFDNAFGEQIRSDAIVGGYQEIVVILRRHNDVECFNLATLIALARKADSDV